MPRERLHGSGSGGSGTSVGPRSRADAAARARSTATSVRTSAARVARTPRSRGASGPRLTVLAVSATFALLPAVLRVHHLPLAYAGALCAVTLGAGIAVRRAARAWRWRPPGA
ncbi:hypothetical protein [Actinomadura kijaniata]|uniref:hypothetical protein n=1 Tax=Actinomadura kijaniata TaxID=46161 RepID=UPI000B198072|nr:hypothetical protein [Actinomadura kijaniata]